MALGIFAAAFCWLGTYFMFPGFFSLGSGIAALVLSKDSAAPFGKVGKITGLIGTILSGIFMFVGLILLIDEM